jgi:hypothetical protein
MQLEGSLPGSQEPATSPSPEPEESSPQLSTLFFQDSFYYYHPIYTYVFQVVSFLHVSQTKYALISRIFHAFCMTRSSHTPWFDHHNPVRDT